MPDPDRLDPEKPGRRLGDHGMEGQRPHLGAVLPQVLALREALLVERLLGQGPGVVPAAPGDPFVDRGAEVHQLGGGQQVGHHHEPVAPEVLDQAGVSEVTAVTVPALPHLADVPHQLVNGRRVEPRRQVDLVRGGRLGTLVKVVRFGCHEPAVDQPDLRHEVSVGTGAGGGGAEAEDTLGPHDGVRRRPSRQEGPVVVALELTCIGVEDVQRPLQHRGVVAVVDVGRRQVAPHAPHPPAQRRRQGGHGALHAAADGLVGVMDVVRRGRDHNGGAVFLDDARELGYHAPGRQGQVSVEVQVQGRVQEDGHEAGPLRRFLRLGPSPLPLAGEPQAGDDTDHGPAPIPQVQERTGTAHRLVVGVGCHVQDGRGHGHSR